MNFKRIRQAASLVLLLAWGGPALAGRIEPYQGLLTRPELVLEDLAGHRRDLAQHRGEVVLVNFWATWCPPCVIEMPSLQRLQAAFEGRPFRVLAVNVEESRERVWRFRQQVGLDLPVLLDRDGAVARAWEVDVYPTSYLLDATGQVRYLALGMLRWDAEAVRDLIEALLPAPAAAGEGAKPLPNPAAQ